MPTLPRGDRSLTGPPSIAQSAYTLDKIQRKAGSTQKGPASPPSHDHLHQALLSINQSYLASRLRRCLTRQQRISMVTGQRDTVRLDRCGYYLICPRCAQHRAWRVTQDVLARVTHVEGQDAQGSRIADALGQLAGEVAHTCKDMEDITIAPGKLTQTKVRLRADLRRLGVRLQQIPRPEIRHIAVHLKSGRQYIPDRGYPDVLGIIQHLCTVTRLIRRAACQYRQGYCWQAITLTLRTLAEYREDPKRYHDLVVGLQQGFRALWVRGPLRAPGAGAVINVHLQDSVNLHALYWGPGVDPEHLAYAWLEITRDSHQIDVRPLRTPADIERWVGYLAGYPHGVQPADRVRYWLAIKGLVLLSYYGVLRGQRNCETTKKSGIILYPEGEV